MNNRLTIKDLAVLLSKPSGKSPESLEKFLRELVEVTRKGIFADRQTQIKGIGAFRIIPVEQRESVDVNTKERIVIPAHYKLSYLPEKELRETVNKPFSFFESIEINDDSEFTSFETALEEKDPDGDLDDTEEIELDEQKEEVGFDRDVIEEEAIVEPEEDPEVEKVITGRDMIDNPPEEEANPVVPLYAPVDVQAEKEERPAREEETHAEEKEKVRTDETDEKPEEAPRPAVAVVTPPPVFHSETRFKEEEQAKEISKPIKEKETMTDYNEYNDRERRSEHDNYRPDRDAYRPEREPERSPVNNTLVTLLLVLVVILLIALGSLVYIGRDTFFGSSDKVAKQPTEATDPIVDTPSGDDSSAFGDGFDFPPEDDDMGDGDGFADTPSDSDATAEAPATGSTADIAVVKVKRGDRLNLLALDYYGNKLFWVYIYEHNKAKLDNPNSIPVGVELKIPAKSVYGIDAKNAESVRKASVKQTQILAKYPNPNAYRYDTYDYNPYNPYNQNQYQQPTHNYY